MEEPKSWQLRLLQQYMLRPNAIYSVLLISIYLSVSFSAATLDLSEIIFLYNSILQLWWTSPLVITFKNNQYPHIGFENH